MATEIMLEHGTDEWREFRRHKRMASETPAVVGVSPYATAADVRKAKLYGEEKPVSAAMQYGIDQEPFARAAYEAVWEPMRPAVLVDGDYGASLDGINMDGDTILEIKSPFIAPHNSERWWLAFMGEVTRHDYAQIQHQLLVSGAKKAHLWVWDGTEGLLVEVLPDPHYWENMKAAWDAFWATLTARDDDPWLEAASLYEAAKIAADDAETALSYAKQKLAALVVGDYGRGGGIEVKRVTKKGLVDWEAVRREHLPEVDVEAYRKPGASFFDVRLVRGK